MCVCLREKERESFKNICERAREREREKETLRVRTSLKNCLIGCCTMARNDLYSPPLSFAFSLSPSLSLSLPMSPNAPTQTLFLSLPAHVTEGSVTSDKEAES
jgi:hypothetical protein